MAMITETEELDESPAAHIRSSTKAWMETVEETMEDAAGAIPGENKGDPLGETVEESPWETIEEGIESHKGRARKLSHSYSPQTMFQVAAQKSHLKRMCEWLLPYFIAVILVISIGSAVMLVSYSRTQQLSRQLLEQYGEYFADE